MSLLGEEKGNTIGFVPNRGRKERRLKERERNDSEVAEKCVSICIILCVCKSETNTKATVHSVLF